LCCSSRPPSAPVTPAISNGSLHWIRARTASIQGPAATRHGLPHVLVGEATRDRPQPLGIDGAVGSTSTRVCRPSSSTSGRKLAASADVEVGATSQVGNARESDCTIARLRQSVARTVCDLHSPRATRPKHLTTEAMSPFQGGLAGRRDPAQSRQARRTRNAATPGRLCDGHHRSMRTASRLTTWSRPSGVPPRRDSSPRRPDQP